MKLALSIVGREPANVRRLEPGSLRSRTGLRRPGTVAASKNSAWLIAAFTVERWNGLVIRKVGSGRAPVSSRSGKAVMKITGTENSREDILDRVDPELSSASWISARTRPGGLLRASAPLRRG